MITFDKISYDNYKNRIEKLAKAKRILHKLRFVICGVLALIVGASVGLMVAKGSYTSDMSLSAQSVMFNEDYKVTAAKAFLSSASEQHIEYRGENGDWTKQKPVKAGKYSARTVTKKLVGYSYSSAVNFEILPLEADFNVNSGSVTYGDLHNYYTVPQLISGHVVDESVLVFNYSDYGAATTSVEVDLDTVRIIDESGEDFTDCYNITPHANTLSIRKRNITVTPLSYEFEYDAQPHSAGNEVTEETLESLVNGDTLDVTTVVSGYGVLDEGAVDARVYNVKCDSNSIKIMHGENEVTGWYYFNCVTSRLTISRRKLTITTHDAQKVYDGKPAENKQLTCENLIEGHVAAVDTTTLCNIADVGTYDNVFKVTVLDGTTNVSNNYEIDEDNSHYGKLTITPCKLNVTTATPDAPHTYDGTPFTDFTFDIAEKDKLNSAFEFTAIGKLADDTTDAGEYENAFEIKAFLNHDDVTKNFEISYTYGKLTVVKRWLTVTTEGDSKVYDGEPLTYKSVTADNVAENQTLKLVTPFSVTNVTGAGGVEIAAKFTVVDVNEKDVGKNYNIEYEKGKLIIEPLQISVKTVDASREYDGTLFSDASCEITRLNAEGKGLYGTDALFPNFTTSRKIAGSEPNVCRYELPTFDGARSNYQIVGEIEYGTLTVTRKAVKVTINPVNAVYGEQLPDEGFELDCGELPADEKLTFTTHYEDAGVTVTPEMWKEYTLLNVGSYSIVCNGDEAILGGEDASVDNYEFTFVKGTLEIKARVIYYATANDTKVYDGTKLQNTDYETYLLSDNTKAGLLNGDKLNLLANPASIVEVQKRPNHNYYTAPNNNYYIDNDATVFGWLEVTPRPVIVYTGSATKPYDGTPLTCGEYEDVKFAVQNQTTGEWTADDSKIGLIEGDSLELVGALVELTNAGEISNLNKYANGNYNIVRYVNGKLTVTKKQLHVKLAGGKITCEYGTVFDPYFFSADVFVDAESGAPVELVDDAKLCIQWHVEGAEGAPDVGTYTLKAYKFWPYEGEWSCDNRGIPQATLLLATDYDVICDDAELVVNKLKVEVTVKDMTVAYGDDLPASDTFGFGEEYTYPDTVQYILTNNVKQILEFEFGYEEENVKNVGTYHFTIKDFAVIGIGGNENNYDVTCSGTLTITARAITVQLKPSKNIHYGEELPENGYEVISGAIAEGDIITFDYAYYLGTAGNTVTPKDWGDYGITATAAYLNGAQIEIESDEENYKITVTDGKLTIDYARIGVQVADITVTYGDEWTYNGENPEIVYGQLYYGETLEIAVRYIVDGKRQSEQPKDAGEYVIELDPSNCKVYDADGNLCEKNNYSFVLQHFDEETNRIFEYEHGTLTINKKQVHIKFKDEKLRYGREDLLQGLATLGADLELAEGSTEPALAYGEVLRVDVGYKKDGVAIEGVHTLHNPWRLSVGEYTKYAVEYYIKANEAADRYIDFGTELKNYEIICDEGALEITPYTVTVKPNDQICVYGTPEDEIEDNGFEYTDGLTVSYDGLPYGENLILSYSYAPSPITDVGKYAIKATATGVDDGDLNNYTVSYEDGELTVIARTIYVVIDNDNNTTYGKAPKNISYKITSDVQGEVKEFELFDGEELKTDFDYYKDGDADKTAVTVKNAGEYGITAVNARVEKAGETSENYIIVVVDGKLTVDKKTVTVELNRIDRVRVYYGNTFSYPAGVDNYVNFDTIELAYNERLEVAVDFLIDGKVGTPKYVDVYQRYAYSARLNDSGCVVYESDGETQIVNGADNYNFVCEDVENLHILSRTVRITLNDISDVPYGDEVSYPDGPNNFKSIENLSDDGFEGMPYGEQFEVRAIVYRKDGKDFYKPVDVGTYSIHASSNFTVVYESDGVTEVNDGTYDGKYNYVIIIDDGSVEIVPREITIKLNSYKIHYGDYGNTFVYPDEVNNYYKFDSDELVYGEQLKAEIKYQLNGEDVTTPRNIGLYRIVGIDYTVYNGEDLADKNNYSVSFEDGELTISKKIIHIVIDNQSCTYGDELPENSYVIKEYLEEDEYVLPYGDKYTALAYGYRADGELVTPRNAGSYFITVTESSITNGTDDVSRNYAVLKAMGTLTINKAELKLSLLNVKDTAYGDYRGYPSGIGNFDAAKTVGIKYNDNFELAVEYEVYDDMYNTGLVTVGDKSTEIPTNAARYYINIVAKDSVIHTTDGEQFDLELNYNVVCEHGEFNISRRGVRVTYTPFECTYGEAFEKPAFTIFVPGTNLDQSEISTTELPYNEGMPDFDFAYEDEDGNVYDTPVNAGNYRVELAKKYVKGREDLAGNYSFYISNAYDETLTINKKQIEITLDNMTSTYGDFEFAQPTTHTFAPTEGVLEYTDALTVQIKFTQVGNEADDTPIARYNVGTYSIVATKFTATYWDGSEETAAGDKLKNYEIVCNHGTLTVTPKDLHVALSQEVEITYGETAPDHAEIPYTVTSDGKVITRLPYEDHLGVARYYSPSQPVNAGTYTIVYDGAAINLNPEDPNYDISGDNGLLTIKRREIEVTVKGGTAVYGYEELPEIAYEVTDGAMVGVEKLVLAYKFSLNGTECEPINVGVYDISVDVDKCAVEGGNALYKNYKVTYVIDGNLEITRASLTVTINNDSFTYGERDINVTFDITVGELYHDDDLELTYTYINKESGAKSGSPTAAGEYAITATADIVGGNESVDNYNISFAENDPTLTIAKRQIEIVLNKGGVTAFTYGDNYGEEICKAEITNATDVITVAVTYTKKEESSASVFRMFRARTFSARETETLIPKDAGTYIATLDFANCVVTDADGNPVDGGIDNYELSADCEAVEFVIARMALTVTVENTAIIYGEKLPTALGYSVTEMPYGESLALTFSFADESGKLPVHKGDYDVTVATEEISGGKLSNYKLEYTNDNPTLTINAKPVTLQLGSMNRSYGGTIIYDVKENNYDVAASDALVSGDELTVTEVKYVGADGTEYAAANPPKNVGSYDIVFVSYTILNADDESAKADYDITWLNGTLVIDSSVITVYTGSNTKPYDGTPLSTVKFTFEGDLGDYEIVVDTDNICERIDATTGDGVDNTTKFKIVDASGNVTSNLKISYGTPGKLKVTPKKAEITITDTSAIYGEYPEIGHTATGLIDGEDVEFNVDFSKDGELVTPSTAGGYFILPVGNYLMNYASNSATVVGGRGKASNYEFEFKPDAALEVTPRHIAITTASGSAEYDGKPFSKPEGYTTEWVVEGERQGFAGLLNGDKLEVDYTASLTEVDTCDNDCTYTASDNYVIDTDKYVYGKLTVTKRTVTAKTADVVATYDGKPHSSDEVTDVGNKLAEGHEFKVTSELVAPVDVCTGVSNKLDVIIVDTNDGDKDVTANYTVKTRYGKITINPRPIKITTGGTTVAEYDGLPHGNTEYDKAEGLLTEFGHKLVVATAFTYTNATDAPEGVDNETTYKVFSGDDDISRNYTITYKCGKIIIGKKSVTVTLNSGVQVQYGDDYAEALTENAVTLVLGETAKLAITVAGGVNGKGTYTATVDWANSIVSNASGEIENGINNYNPVFEPASVDFDDIPREITVTLNADGKTQFAYGDDYDRAIRAAKVETMVGDETFKAEVTYNVDKPKYVNEYTATLDLARCAVIGGDIKNYNVTCDEVTFNIIAKEITVYMDDITVRYDQTPAYPEGASGHKNVDGLVDGDTITVIPAFEKNGVRVTEFTAGTYDIVCDGIVINGGAVSVDNYSVTTGEPYGTLTVEGIGIEIVRKTVTKPYDGTPLVLNNHATEEEVSYVTSDGNPLPAGYVLELVAGGATADGNVSSSCANTAEYKVLNAEGNEAGEYEISYQSNDARLEIEPRLIKITTDTPEARAYNGTALIAERYTITEGTLAENQDIVTSNPAKLTDVDSIPNSMDIKIMAGSEDVTDNYDIRVTFGTLTVTKLTVEVTIESVSKVYGEDTGVNKTCEQALVDGETLVYGLLVDGEASATALLNFGSYGITADQSTVSVRGGKLDNYDITFNTDATLTVEKRQIIVTTADGEAEYSGEPFSKPEGYTTEWIKDGVAQGVAGLINGDTLKPTYVASITEIGSDGNDCAYVVNENADNYDIVEYVYGTLTVTKAKITVTTNEISGVYRGTAYSDGGFTYRGNLLDAHVISISGSPLEFLDVISGAKNVFAVEITEKVGGADVSDYYDVAYEYGDVVITKRALTITLNDAEKSFEYGDSLFDGKFKNVTVGELAENDQLTTVALKYSTKSGAAPVNAGNYTVMLDLENSVIEHSGAGNVIGNYEITCEAVDFAITRRNVTLTLGTWADEEYDGEEHDYNTNGCKLASGSTLFGGESLANVVVKYSLDEDGKAALNGAPKDADTYYVFLDTAETTVNGADGAVSIETNYIVTCERLEFVVTPRKLKVTLSDVSHTYDGKAYDFASGDGFAADPCDGDEVKCNVTYGDEEPVNAGTYTVTFVETLEFTSGKASNYTLDKENSTLTCTLTIDARKITVTVANRDVEKGNEEYTRANVSGGFVAGDFEKIDDEDIEFTYSDKDGNQLDGVPSDVGTYYVTVTLGGEVMANYDVTEPKAGKLIVTERKVLVTPVYKGSEKTYDGNAVEYGLFDYTHVHNVAGANGEAGFFDTDLGNIKATFTFTDENDKKYVGIAPTNAGTYTLSVKLTTLSGDKIGGYEIECKDVEFTIARCKLSYTVAVDGAGTYEYSNSRPAFTADLVKYNGFINGNELPEEYSFELFYGDKPVTRYNVGTYQVKMAFEGMENYDVTATTAQIKITPRTIVVLPTDPFGGAKQVYNGTNLKLGAKNYTLRSGALAVGDDLSIVSTEFAPTSKSGSLTIANVIIVDEASGENAKGNYTVYSVYNATNATIKELKLSSIDFKVLVEYDVTDVHYSIGEGVFPDTGEYPYTGTGTFNYSGKSFVYTFDGSKIYKVLSFGHYVSVVSNMITVPAAAGDYPELITNRVKVFDADGNNVTAIYNLICDNPEAAKITVSENVLTVNLSEVVVDELTSGEMLNCEVTGLYPGATPAHTAEVYAFNVDDEWIIGVTVFSTSASGRKTDLSANYKLSESSTLSGATVKILTLDEADLYSRQPLGVTIKVTTEQLEGGRGSVYNADDNGRLVLTDSEDYYTVDGELQAGHELQVLVLVDESGNYSLGVTVFKTENGRRVEASNSYRLKNIETEDVAASYLTVSQVSDLQRELYIDFYDAFDAEGKPIIENGMLKGYSANGLNEADNHTLEIRVEDNGDGTYTLKLVVYQVKAGSTKKYNKAMSYKLVYDAPSQVKEASFVTGALS